VQRAGGVGQYCLVARATETLADRWTPLIIRELLAGIRHLNDLDGACQESPAP